MPNFEWLNQIPDNEWERGETGSMTLSFLVREFMTRSGILNVSDDRWRGQFDIWGIEQKRRYQHAHRPDLPFGPAVMILAQVPTGVVVERVQKSG